MCDELNKKITDWVYAQGYPLEMRVARAFRTKKFRTTQSEYYIDPENGDSREIDVVASKQYTIDESLVKISVCVECKSTKKHPWVVFTSRDTQLAKPASVVQRPASDLGYSLLYSICQTSRVRA